MHRKSEFGVYYKKKDYAGISKRILILIILFLIIYLYLAGLKATKFGTLGYKLTGVKLVNLMGECPYLSLTSLRFGFLFINPLDPFLDIIWLGGEQNRQSLRDKVAGTYVVKKISQPIGYGKIKLSEHYFLAWNMLFREVERK